MVNQARSAHYTLLFSYIKTFVVAFGESAVEHGKIMQTRNWSVGPNNIDKEKEYINLGVYKNYTFSQN